MSSRLRFWMVFACIGVLLVAVLVLGYAWFDTVVTLSYARQQQHTERARVELLKDLVGRTGANLTRGEFERIVREHFESDHVVKREGDSIQVDDVIFRFQGDRLARVQLLGEEQGAGS